MSASTCIRQFFLFFLSIQLACSLSLSLKLLNIKNVALARSFMTVETDSYLTTRDIIGWRAGLPLNCAACEFHHFAGPVFTAQLCRSAVLREGVLK